MTVCKREQLRGLSYEVAECYGKPHIGAFYKGSGVKTHKVTEHVRCTCCPSRATNAHHNPPLSRGRNFLLMTERGAILLKPALFALCGSGTTGCHNGFHGGARFKARWEWDCDDYARMWWSGELFEKGIKPHSDELYEYGCWVINDAKKGSEFRVRL